MSDKALFHPNGSVNAQNTHSTWHWNTKNTMQEVPLHDQKASVWCAVSAQRIIGYIYIYLWHNELKMYFGTIFSNAC
jgi:hypothetical protein